MCFNCDFSFSEDESSCDYRKKVPRVIAPQEIAALSRVVISVPIGSSNASIKWLFVDAEEEQVVLQGEY